MKILFVSAEVSPFAKVGGLADVAGSLPLALHRLGMDVRIAMPAYRMVEQDPRNLAKRIAEFDVRVGPDWVQRGHVSRIFLDEVPVYLVGGDPRFDQTVSSETVYIAGAEQHLFFARAVLDGMRELDWIPDVVHANDWHTGFIPVFMRESRDREWANVASIFTIHNLAYQGCFDPTLLDKVGLPQELYNMHQLEAYGQVNFLKAGAVFSDMVNTVSKRYAEEIQSEGFGCGLHGVMRMLHTHGALSGILNGLDTGLFDPSVDPNLPAHFSAKEPEGKAVCRAKLLEEVGLAPIEGAPVMGVVSRLSEQKGMDLMVRAADAMFAQPTQLIVLGVGDPWLAGEFKKMQAKCPGHFRLVERFDVSFAQRVYAGSDIFLMPSSFEPCGLGQLIALRYGTVPLVRETGGLADTVWDGVNGFSFKDRTPEGLAATVARARAAYLDADRWRALVLKGLGGDYSWDKSAVSYVNLYRRAIGSRFGALAPTL